MKPLKGKHVPVLPLKNIEPVYGIDKAFRGNENGKFQAAVVKLLACIAYESCGETFLYFLCNYCRQLDNLVNLMNAFPMKRAITGLTARLRIQCTLYSEAT